MVLRLADAGRMPRLGQMGMDFTTVFEDLPTTLQKVLFHVHVYF